ncbi:MAG: MazG nucleotide pyrophosphohydrolase domain-containing protein [Candidatus Methanospirareceae archaeon]
MEIKEFQEVMREIYFERDKRRGVEGNILRLLEELGELTRAIRKGDKVGMKEEFADVLAWTASLANILDVDLEAAVIEKYDSRCPRCGKAPCMCEGL